MKLTAIVAMTADRVIGKDGDLPWYLPDDLKFFKKQTLGHPILMGRKTFDSIGRPLPKRENIVITRDSSWSHEGVTVIHEADALKNHSHHERIYIIGGAQIYTSFLPLLEDIIITHVHEAHAGDTFFPTYEKDFAKSELILAHEDFTIRRHYR